MNEKLKVVKQTIGRSTRYVIVSNKPNPYNKSKFIIAFSRRASAVKMKKELEQKMKN